MAAGGNGGYPGGHHGGMGYPGGGYPGGGGGYPRGGGGYPGGGQSEPKVDGKKILAQISEETGGRLFEVTKKETVDQIYAQPSKKSFVPNTCLDIRPTKPTAAPDTTSWR